LDSTIHPEWYSNPTLLVRTRRVGQQGQEFAFGRSCSALPLVFGPLPAFGEGAMTRFRKAAMRKKRIVYWEFSIEIIGPRYRTKAEGRRIHRILSRKLLRQVEEAARSTTQSKLPSGFKAKIY